MDKDIIRPGRVVLLTGYTIEEKTQGMQNLISELHHRGLWYEKIEHGEDVDDEFETIYYTALAVIDDPRKTVILGMENDHQEVHPPTYERNNLLTRIELHCVHGESRLVSVLTEVADELSCPEWTWKPDQILPAYSIGKDQLAGLCGYDSDVSQTKLADTLNVSRGYLKKVLTRNMDFAVEDITDKVEGDSGNAKIIVLAPHPKARDRYHS